MKNIPSFEDFLTETVHLNNNPYTDRMCLDWVLQGVKDVMYLSTSDNPIIDNSETLEVLADARKAGLNEIKLKNRKEGEAWIMYSNSKRAETKAKKLASIAEKMKGYLNDKTPAEATEIGRLLDYSELDIKSYIKRNYGK